MSLKETPPSIVYHYCGLETFYNIISNYTIRMSNISKTNDSEEMTYIISQNRYWISQLLNKYNNRLENSFKLRDSFVDNAFDYRLNELSTIFYIACFSQKNDLLSQWRGYADDACGVSIGVSTDVFYPLINSNSEHYKFSEVKYHKEDLASSILKYVDKEIDNKWSNDSQQDSVLLMNSVDSLILALIYNSTLYKNPTFEEEAEWRLIYNPFGYVRAFTDRSMYYDRMSEIFIQGNENGGFVRKPMQFQIKKDKIVSYVDLSFEKVKNEFIKEIIIGAKANMLDMDLELFLISKGYDPYKMQIHKSKIPYR